MLFGAGINTIAAHCHLTLGYDLAINCITKLQAQDEHGFFKVEATLGRVSATRALRIDATCLTRCEVGLN